VHIGDCLCCKLSATMPARSALTSGLAYTNGTSNLPQPCAVCMHPPCRLVCCQVPSEYHYLLLYPDRLAAVNQVSGKLVALLRTRPPAASPAFGVGGGAGLLGGIPVAGRRNREQ
jgi:hypothetical protein